MLDKIFIKHSSSEDISTYEPCSLNIFVGPNNSGKSLLLRELFQEFTETGYYQSLLLDGTLLAPLSKKIIDELLENDRNHLSQYNPDYLNIFGEHNSHIDMISRSLFNQIADGSINDYKKEEYRRFKRHILSKQILLLNGATRLNSMKPKDFSTLPNSGINNPVNTLLNNKELVDNLRVYILDAFNLYLEIFLNSGQANFVLSKEPLEENLRLSVKPEATSFLLENSYDDDFTSDGRKAFLGILSEIIAGDPQLLLLDEPEAFLHPPLARKLGNVVSKLINETSKQVFISTHSSDFIMGCIESHVPLNIVRLTYENEISTFKQVDTSVLEKIMNNPLLKSTNVLKAIFYQKVIVTESDSDRAFYEEINNRLLSYKPEWGITDCLFINAQNKQTTGIIVQTLREIGVSAVAIVDLDFIKDGKGEFADKYLSPAHIGTASHSGLQSNRSTLKSAFDDIQKNTGQEKPELMKKVGLTALKSENPDVYTMGKEFLNSLNSYGLFPVPYGELESWLKNFDVPGHGSNWLTSIFEKMGDNPRIDTFLKPSDDDVWKFIHTIKTWFDNPNKKGMPS